MLKDIARYCIWLAKNIVLISIVYMLAQREIQKRQDKMQECKIVTRRMYINIANFLNL